MKIFDIRPNLAKVIVSDEFATTISNMQLGPEERRHVHGPRKSWELNFQKDVYDANEAWNFYVDRKGSFEAFKFECPIDKKVYTVKFAEDNLSRVVFQRRMYEFGIRLVEVYE